MANRSADTVELKLRPRTDLVKKLRALAPQCGFKTGNELAVALLEIGADLLERGELPAQLPATLLRLRAHLHGEEAQVPSPELREMVAELVRETLAGIEAEKKKAQEDRGAFGAIRRAGREAIERQKQTRAAQKKDAA